MTDILILCFLVTLSVFFILLHYYKKYCVDAYRQEIFKIRDELFNFAAEGGIDFSHPAYAMVRTYLNGTIRFTEHLSLVRMITANVVLKRHASHFEADIANRLKGLTEAQREAISVALDKAAAYTVLYLVRKNVAVVLLFEMFRCIGLMQDVIKKNTIKATLAKQYKTTYSDVIYEEGSHRFA